MGIWPEKFTSKDNRAPNQSDATGGDKNDSDNDSDLFVNTNRAHHAVDGDSEESSDSDSIENSDSDASDADSGECAFCRFNFESTRTNSIQSFGNVDFTLQRTMQAILKKMRQMEKTTRVKNRIVNPMKERNTQFTHLIELYSGV